MFSVTISEKGGQQSEYEFSKPEITIGRMKGNDVVLPKGNVSKQHTRIFLRDGDFFIVDLKSTNGTYVNGRKITSEQQIGADDKIYIGDFILQLNRQNQQDAPPKPPSAPPAEGAGGRPDGGAQSGGGGRNFPTVMDGAHQASSQAGPTAESDSPAQRTASSPGTGGSAPVSGGSPSGGTPSGGTPTGSGAPVAGGGPASAGSGGRSPSKTPVPDSPQSDDIRKTQGDSAPADLSADIEPLDDGVEPVGSEPTPPPSAPTGAGSKPQPPAGNQPPSPAPNSPSQPPVGQQQSPRSPQPVPDHGSVGAPKSLDSHFDESFHRAQQDVTRKFFDTISPDELPGQYPLEDKTTRQRMRNAVEQAVKSVGADVDNDRLTELLTSEAVGLGPLDDYLEDDAVETIYVNAYDRIVVRKNSELVVAEHAFSTPEMLDAVARRLLADEDDDSLSGEIRFDDGTRIHVLLPPVAVDGPTLTIQKPNRYFPELADLAADGTMSTGMAEFLERAVEAGRSILIAGPTSSGKSTLMAALTKAVPDSARLIAVEQHSNLPVDAPNFIGLEASPSSDCDMRFLLRNAVAMHPERILVDECRGAEAYDWVTAATGGTEGSMMTLHGTSAVDALGRLESMCLMAADDISPRGLRQQIAHSVDLVVVLNTTADRGFRVQQIAEVQGVDLDAFRLNDIFYYRVEGTAGEFHPTGYIPLFYEDLRHTGYDVDLGIFRE